MLKQDVLDQRDIEEIIAVFYHEMLNDPIVGYIFTDIAKIDLDAHLPVIVKFWSDIVFRTKNYSGNALHKHLQLNQIISLKPGHFTRWLYLFKNAVDAQHSGPNADLMIERAELVAKSISAAISDRKKGEMQLVLPDD